MHPGFLPPGEFALYFDTPGDDSVPVNQTVFIDGLGLDLDGQLDRFDFQGVMKEAVCHFGLALCIGVLQSGQRIERNVTLDDNREFHRYRIRLCHRLRSHLNPGTVRLGEWTGLPDSTAGRGCQNGGEKQKDREEVFHRLGCRLVFIFQYLVQFGLELPELDIVTGFDSEDGTAEDKQFTDDAHGTGVNLAQGLDEEKAHARDEDAGAEARDGDDALKARELHFLFVGHKAWAIWWVSQP